MTRGQQAVEGHVRQAVIENPVINSAFVEPGKHYKFDDGTTDEIVTSRSPSARIVGWA